MFLLLFKKFKCFVSIKLDKHGMISCIITKIVQTFDCNRTEFNLYGIFSNYIASECQASK